MANNIQIYQLTAKSSAALTDSFAVDDNSVNHVTWKVSGTNLVDLVAANIAGAPYVIGDIIYANSTSTLSNLPDIAVNNVLLSGGVGSVPSYGKVTYGHMQTESSHTLLGNPTAGSLIPGEITLGATMNFIGSALQTVSITGDVTASANSFATTIAANAVTYPKFQQVAASSLVGNPTGSLANSQGITLGTGLSFVGSALTATAFDIVKSWNGSTTQVDVTAGTDISITGGEIAFTGNLVVSSWDGSTTPVNVTQGTGITITGGVISATGDLSVNLQDSYGNGVPPFKGFIFLDNDNASPFVVAGTYSGAPQVNIVSMNDTDPNIATITAWGYDFYGKNSASNTLSYARIEATAAVSTSTEESGNLFLKVKNQGSDVSPVIIDGLNKEITVNGFAFTQLQDTSSYTVPKNYIINQTSDVVSNSYFLGNQTTDNKVWIYGVDGVTYRQSLANDAFGSITDYLQVERSGTNIERIKLFTGNSVPIIEFITGGVINLPTILPNKYLVSDSGSNLSYIDGPDSGVTTSTVTAVSGSSSPSTAEVFYSTVSNASGNTVFCTATFTFTATNTSPVLRLENPIARTFTGSGQADGLGCVFITITPTSAVNTIYEINTTNGFNDIDIKMVVAVGAGDYTCKVFYSYLL